MSFEARLIVVTLAAFGAGGLAGAALVPWLWGRLTAPTAGGAGGSAAATAALAGRARRGRPRSLAAISYLLFESRTAEEGAGVTLFGLAAVAIGAAVTSLARSWRLSVGDAPHAATTGWRPASRSSCRARRSRRSRSRRRFPSWRSSASSVRGSIVARSVLEACTADELATIVAHEQAHVAHRDNLAPRAVPAGARRGRLAAARARLLGAWRDATEEAADDCAAQRGRIATGDAGAGAHQSGTARAGATSLPAPLPASALYRGENLDRRVRRLLAPPADPSGPRASFVAAAGRLRCSPWRPAVLRSAPSRT